jgi:hypothetical protein
LGGLVRLTQRAAYHGTKHSALGITKSAGFEYAPLCCAPAASGHAAAAAPNIAMNSRLFIR